MPRGWGPAVLMDMSPIKAADSRRMDHAPNYIGHDQNVVPTPGNLSFTFASNIVFYGNIFEHLGAVGLQFGPGSSNNTINSNLFTDISSSAIEIGAVTALDAHPK